MVLLVLLAWCEAGERNSEQLDFSGRFFYFHDYGGAVGISSAGLRGEHSLIAGCFGAYCHIRGDSGKKTMVYVLSCSYLLCAGFFNLSIFGSAFYDGGCSLLSAGV